MGMTNWIALLSGLTAVLSLIYIVVKDVLADAREGGKTSVILNDVNGKLAKIDERQGRFEAKQEAYLERLVAVEQSTKSAHHRLDGLENMINGGKNNE